MTEDAHIRRLEVAASRVVEEVKAGRLKVPMLPAAATDAMQAANDAKSTLATFTKILAPDPLLSAKVLNLANSSLYARGAPVTSLRNAVMMLGADALREVLYQAVAEAFIFRGGQAGALQRQRNHALGVAHITKMVCATVGIDAEYALVCGLLHDLGRMVLMGLMGQGGMKELSPAEAEELIERIHPIIGGLVATKWQLPSLVVEATMRHHTYRGFAGEESYSRMGNIIAVAEWVAQYHGLGEHEPSRTPTSQDDRPERREGEDDGDAALAAQAEVVPAVVDLRLSPEALVQLVRQAAGLRMP